MKQMKKLIFPFFLTLMFLILPVNAATQKTALINSGKQITITIRTGQSTQLSVANYNKKVSYTVDNKKIASVSSQGLLTGKKAGSAKLTVKYASKKFNCTVKVVKSGSKKVVVKYSKPASEITPDKTIGSVYIPRTGSKYHSKATCSGMNNPSKVSLTEAKKRGYTPCKKCYK